METAHEILQEGESTARWAFREPGFMGSIKQMLLCARCGGPAAKGRHEKMHVYHMAKPTSHALCTACYQALPD